MKRFKSRELMVDVLPESYTDKLFPLGACDAGGQSEICGKKSAAYCQAPTNPCKQPTKALEVPQEPVKKKNAPFGGDIAYLTALKTQLRETLARPYAP